MQTLHGRACELDLSLHKRYIVFCHLYTETLQLYQLYAETRIEEMERDAHFQIAPRRKLKEDVF